MLICCIFKKIMFSSLGLGRMLCHPKHKSLVLKSQTVWIEFKVQVTWLLCLHLCVLLFGASFLCVLPTITQTEQRHDTADNNGDDYSSSSLMQNIKVKEQELCLLSILLSHENSRERWTVARQTTASTDQSSHKTSSQLCYFKYSRDQVHLAYLFEDFKLFHLITY